MNRGSDSILSVYSDARAEYTKQLCVFLVPAYFQFFTDLLEKAKRDMINEPRRALWQFQTYLNEIHDWNMEKVTSEIHRINTNCGCDYMDDLLTAVFIAHTKVLTAIRLSSNKKKIEINVPKVDHFLFKVLCETSKLLWSSTYLFRDGISGVEKQQNYRTIEQIINEGILQAVRSLVPVKSILRDFINNDATDENESDDEEEEKEKTIEELHIPEQPTIVPEEKPVVTPEQKSELNTIQNQVPVEEVQAKNEIVEPAQQTIIIDDKPTVRFGEYDAVFDTENPLESDMIFDPKDDDDDDEVPALEILEEDGAELSEGLDFDSLDEKPESDDLGQADYEELS